MRPAAFPDGIPTDYTGQIAEVTARLDAGAEIAAQALLGEIDALAALEGLLGLVEHCRLRLKAVSR